VTLIACEHCSAEIDVAKDPRCVVYDPSGSTDVICEGCRYRAWTTRQRVQIEQRDDRIKRGWRV
jgi:hypothetical protein